MYVCPDYCSLVTLHMCAGSHKLQQEWTEAAHACHCTAQMALFTTGRKRWGFGLSFDSFPEQELSEYTCLIVIMKQTPYALLTAEPCSHNVRL